MKLMDVAGDGTGVKKHVIKQHNRNDDDGIGGRGGYNAARSLLICGSGSLSTPCLVLIAVCCTIF